MWLVGCRQERGAGRRGERPPGARSAWVLKAKPPLKCLPQKRLSSWFLALQLRVGFPGPVRRWGHPKAQLGLAIKGTGSGQPWAGGGGDGQSTARLDPRHTCSSSEISTGTTQLGKPDSIYSPRKRGHLCPQAPAGHRSQSSVARVYGVRWQWTEHNGQVTEPQFLHLGLCGLESTQWVLKRDRGCSSLWLSRDGAWSPDLQRPC